MASPSQAQLVVVRNVLAVARQFRAAGLCPVPDLAHLAITLQESSWDDQAVGDAGASFGPYQLDQDAHPGTDQLALSAWANYGFHVCASPWADAWLALSGDQTWQYVGQRPAFLEAFAPRAQGSIAWTPGLGAQNYAAALVALELVS